MGWKQSWKWIRRARQHTCQWKVVEAVAEAYEAVKGCLAERLMAALEAGENAGGDVRGRQSAALLVVRGAVGGAATAIGSFT
jgi:uncharacterized Ntn-hydrolase superfamily protein